MINSITQQTDYSRKELYHFLSGRDLPEFVKEASIEEVTDSSLNKEAYADEAGKLFPCWNKASTFVSQAFLINKKASIAKVKGKGYVAKVEKALEKAASDFGIVEDIKNYNAGVTKVASTAGHEIVSNLGDSEVVLYTIKSAEECTKHAEHFIKNIENFPFEWRRPMANQFVKAAEENGLDDLPDLLLKYAGQYYPDSLTVKQELVRRSRRFPEQNERYTKLASDVENIGSLDEFFKLAETCYFMEKNAGLYDKPKSRMILGDPVDKLFTLHLDKVANMLNTVTMAGERFDVDELEKISSDIYEKAFGFSFSPKEAEFKDIALTLPKSDVALFKQLSGVQPIA